MGTTGDAWFSSQAGRGRGMFPGVLCFPACSRLHRGTQPPAPPAAACGIDPRGSQSLDVFLILSPVCIKLFARWAFTALLLREQNRMNMSYVGANGSTFPMVLSYCGMSPHPPHWTPGKLCLFHRLTFSWWEKLSSQVKERLPVLELQPVLSSAVCRGRWTSQQPLEPLQMEPAETPQGGQEVVLLGGMTCPSALLPAWSSSLIDISLPSWVLLVRFVWKTAKVCVTEAGPLCTETRQPQETLDSVIHCYSHVKVSRKRQNHY